MKINDELDVVLEFQMGKFLLFFVLLDEKLVYQQLIKFNLLVVNCLGGIFCNEL